MSTSHVLEQALLLHGGGEALGLDAIARKVALDQPIDELTAYRRRAIAKAC